MRRCSICELILQPGDQTSNGSPEGLAPLGIAQRKPSNSIRTLVREDIDSWGGTRHESMHEVVV